MSKKEEMKFTKYEMTRLIGSRALQLANGAPLLIKLSEKELEDIKYNPIEIAKKEFEAGVIPMTVLREMPKPPAAIGSEAAKKEEATQ